MDDFDLDQFARRLAEAVAWCIDRANPATVGDSLWTPSLRPHQLLERPTDAEREVAYKLPWGKRGPYFDVYARFASYPYAQQLEIVSEAMGKRAQILAENDRYPTDTGLDLAGGRVLLFYPDGSLSDGAAELATKGFFDAENLPAWDSWVWYMGDSERASLRENLRKAGDPSFSSINFLDYLVSWVPPTLLEAVDQGIEVNPEQCIQWADSVDTSLTRALRRPGLL